MLEVSFLIAFLFYMPGLLEKEIIWYKEIYRLNMNYYGIIHYVYFVCVCTRSFRRKKKNFKNTLKLERNNYYFVIDKKINYKFKLYF